MTPEQENIYLRSRVAELEKSKADLEIDYAFVFSLPPIVERTFRLLLQHPRVTTEQLAARLPVGAEPKCAIFRLRKFLKRHGFDVQSRRHLGYWLDPADKERLVEMAKVTLAGNKKAM